MTLRLSPESPNLPEVLVNSWYASSWMGMLIPDHPCVFKEKIKNKKYLAFQK